jgi:hypothetical protein
MNHNSQTSLCQEKCLETAHLIEDAADDLVIKPTPDGNGRPQNLVMAVDQGQTIPQLQNAFKKKITFRIKQETPNLVFEQTTLQTEMVPLTHSTDEDEAKYPVAIDDNGTPNISAPSTALEALCATLREPLFEDENNYHDDSDESDTLCCDCHEPAAGDLRYRGNFICGACCDRRSVPETLKNEIEMSNIAPPNANIVVALQPQQPEVSNATDPRANPLPSANSPSAPELLESSSSPKPSQPSGSNQPVIPPSPFQPLTPSAPLEPRRPPMRNDLNQHKMPAFQAMLAQHHYQNFADPDAVQEALINAPPQIPLPPQQFVPAVIPPTIMRECRYGQRCASAGCQYKHKKKDKMCRFGMACNRFVGCSLDHGEGEVTKGKEATLSAPLGGWVVKEQFRSLYVYQSIVDAVYNLPIIVNTEMEKKILNDKGFVTKFMARSPNPHGIAACLRTASIRMMLLKAYSAGDRVLLCPFDFSRIYHVARDLNNACNLSDTTKFWIVSKDTRMVSQDYTRRIEEPMCDQSFCTAAMYNDTYHGLEPESVRRIILDPSNQIKRVYVCGIDLIGPFGVVAGQVFCKLRNKEYVCYVDDIQKPYVHPALEWMHKKDWVDVTYDYNHNGRTYVVPSWLVINNSPCLGGKFIRVLELVGIEPLNPSDPPYANPSTEYTRTISLNHKIAYKNFYGLRGELPLKSEERNIVVHKVLYEEMSITFGTINFSLLNNSTIHRELTDSFSKDAEFNQLKEKFGELAERLSRDTYTALVYAQRNELALNTELGYHFAAPAIDREQIIKAKAYDQHFVDVYSLCFAISVFILCHFLYEKIGVGIISAGLRTGLDLYEVHLENNFILLFLGMLGSIGESFCFLRLNMDWRAKFFISFGGHLLADFFGVSANQLFDFAAGSFLISPKIVYLGLRIVASVVATQPVIVHLLWNGLLLALSVGNLIEKGLLVAASASMNIFVIPLFFLTWSYNRRNFNGVWIKFVQHWNANNILDARQVHGLSPIPQKYRLLSAWAHPFLYLKKKMDPLKNLTARLGLQKVQLDSIPATDRQHKITPMIITNGLLGTPTSGNHSTMNACRIRNCVKTPDATSPSAWRSVSGQLASFIRYRLRGKPIEPHDLDEWASHYQKSWKRDEVRKYLDERKKGTTYFYDPSDNKCCPGEVLKKLKKKGLGMFVKTDESLNFKTEGVFAALKARIIMTVPLWVQVATQPWLYPATDRLKYAIKRVFTIVLGGVSKRFWFTYASGMNGDDLTYWLQQARKLAVTGVICSIILGDDSLTILQFRGKIMYLEIDYSHYDQSQRQCQVAAEYRILLSLSVPIGAAQLLECVTTCKAKARKRNLKDSLTMVFNDPVNKRVTGAPNTSLSNSTNNIIGLIIASFDDFSEEGFRKVGFVAKKQYHDSVQKTTFLRGTWWPHTDGVDRWGLLPSSILKLGKVLSYVKTQKDLERIAYGTALGMGDVPIDFPVLGVFRAKMLALGIKNDAIRNPYKPITNVNSKVDVDFVRSWMNDRYGSTNSEIELAEKLIKDVVVLPSFIGCSLFEKLAADY